MSERQDVSTGERKAPRLTLPAVDVYPDLTRGRPFRAKLVKTHDLGIGDHQAAQQVKDIFKCEDKLFVQLSWPSVCLAYCLPYLGPDSVFV